VNSLVRDEHLERADDLGERDGFVGLPSCGRLDVVDKDNEILVLALVVAFYLGCFSASHDCGVWYWVR
jgi:hypothetical protein